jgi:hypothetical protein
VFHLERCYLACGDSAILIWWRILDLRVDFDLKFGSAVLRKLYVEAARVRLTSGGSRLPDAGQVNQNRPGSGARLFAV